MERQKLSSTFSCFVANMKSVPEGGAGPDKVLRKYNLSAARSLLSLIAGGLWLGSHTMKRINIFVEMLYNFNKVHKRPKDPTTGISCSEPLTNPLLLLLLLFRVLKRKLPRKDLFTTFRADGSCVTQSFCSLCDDRQQEDSLQWGSSIVIIECRLGNIMIHWLHIRFTNNIQIRPFVVCGAILGRALGGIGDLLGTRKNHNF